MEEIQKRLEIIRENIEKACSLANRKSEEIVILGATKGVSPSQIEIAANLGIRIFGENRVQEAKQKIPEVKVKGIHWHMIGHLQRNKVKYAIKLFEMIQSIENLGTALEIEKRAKEPMPILIEINTSFEPSKYGLEPDESVVKRFIDELLKLKKLKIQGFMTLGPYPPEEKKSRKSFALLRKLKEEMEQKFGMHFPILSMGMSEDYFWAILEGATMIRLGRAIFGERK